MSPNIIKRCWMSPVLAKGAQGTQSIKKFYAKGAELAQFVTKTAEWVQLLGKRAEGA